MNSALKKKLIAGIIMAIAVLLTMYFLILPAVTLDKQTYCGFKEHTHHSEAAGCYKTVKECVCGEKESKGHQHTDKCYKTEKELVCPLKEGESNGKDEKPHKHTDKCYEEKQVLTCEKEESHGHQHSDECYIEKKKLVCKKDIHEHTAACYSNPDGDVEKAETWEKTMADVDLTGNWAKDIVTIANTQMGYCESKTNYDIVGKDTKKGYTRYGQWYGDHYGDWCAMFCSFVLHYSGVTSDIIPYEANCQKWIDKVKAIDADDDKETKRDYQLYHAQGTGYVPKSGDIIFFDWAGKVKNQHSDHVGFVVDLIVEEEDEDKKSDKDAKKDDENKIVKIKTLEGNSAGTVRNKEYEIDSDCIMGYIEIPTNPDPLNSPVRVSDVEKIDKTVADSMTEKEIKEAEEEAQKAKEEAKKEEEVVETAATKSLEKKKTVKKTLLAAAPIEVPPTYLSDAAGKYTLAGSWNDSALDTAFTATVKSVAKNKTAGLQYKDGSEWKTSNTANSSKNGSNVAVTNTVAITDIAQKFRTTNNGTASNEFTVYDILESIKPGFDDWLRNSYRQNFGATKLPETITELYAAFDTYYNMPAVTIAAGTPLSDNTFNVTATAKNSDGSPATGVTYSWEYKDGDTWKSLSEASGASFNSGDITVFGSGGNMVRCKLMDGSSLKAISNELLVNPQQVIYDNAINAINTGLKLSQYPLDGGTFDVHITLDDKSNFKDHFYYENVKNDHNRAATGNADYEGVKALTEVPFEDAESYYNYLAKTYIDAKGAGKSDAEALAAVKTEWDKYIYDLFDPHAAIMGNVTYSPYPTSTYGDDRIEWVKDGTTSFHAKSSGSSSLNATVDGLNYDKLKNTVDYNGVVDNLTKSVTAAAAGDDNVDRKYNVKIGADCQAKGNAPVALIIQIQTAWQLFDLDHANAQIGVGQTEVGSASENNTQMANLYAIKHALIDLANYMEQEYQGGNLVLGISEVKHGGSTTMFLGKDGSGNPCYVTNDPEIIKQGLYGFDSFGNCEHVHYDTNTLVSTVNNLSSNLSYLYKSSTQPDFVLTDDDIRKCAVIFGGTTERNNTTNGYNCPLPWSTFQSAGLNSVYGIQVNNGTGINGMPSSWLSNTTNLSGSAFKDGTGSTYTKLYQAYTEEQVFNTLREIAEKEMKAKMIDIADTNLKVFNVDISDTVENEFEIDKSKPITITIKPYKGTGTPEVKSFRYFPAEYDETDPTVVVSEAGWYEFTESGGEYVRGDAASYEEDDMTYGLTVTEDADGYTKVNYKMPEINNGKHADLDFGIVARNDFIGSNNVMSNVGTPKADFTYDDSGTLGDATAETTDTPEVNVPIRYSVKDGGHAEVELGTDVDLAELGSEGIVENVHSLLENYDQISGTLTYEWEDTVTGERFKVPCSVQVKDGVVQGDFAGNLPNKADLEHIYTANESTSSAGKDFKLHVIFTPNTVVDNDNFSDATTAAAVLKKDKSGLVNIYTPPVPETRDVVIRKVWDADPPAGRDSLDFILKAEWKDNGGNTIQKYVKLKDKNDMDKTAFDSFSDNSADGVVTLDDSMTISGTDKETWERTIKNLPGIKDSHEIIYNIEEVGIGTGDLASYAVKYDANTEIEEKPVPSGLYSKKDFDFGKDLYNQDIIVEYKYKAAGEPDSSYKTETALVKGITTAKKKATLTISGLPLQSDSTPYAKYVITSIKDTNGNIIKSNQIDMNDVKESGTPCTVKIVLSSNLDSKISNGEWWYKLNGKQYYSPMFSTIEPGDTYTIELPGEYYYSNGKYTPEINLTELKLVYLKSGGSGKYLDSGAKVSVTYNRTNLSKPERFEYVGVTTWVATNMQETAPVKFTKFVQDKREGVTDSTLFHFVATSSTPFVGGVQTGSTAQNVTFSTDNCTVEFDLNDEGLLNLIAPMGATITVTETNPQGYSPIIKEYRKDGVNDATAEFTVTRSTGTELNIYNKTGYEIPNTGGIGTRIFYILGTILALGAALILITRRRMNAR